MREAQLYARRIKKLTGVNVLQHSRKRDIIEHRALLVKILYDVEGYTLYKIRDFFRSNGKKYDHSTVVHTLKNYDMYARYNLNIEPLFAMLVNVIDTPNAKRIAAKSLIDNFNKSKLDWTLLLMKDINKIDNKLNPKAFHKEIIKTYKKYVIYMKMYKIEIDKVYPREGNPRLIKDEKFNKLVQSVESFPQMLELRPIVIDEDNVILGGNMRYEALKHTGAKEINVVNTIGLTEEQKQEFIVKDNVPFGEWDWNILSNEWEVDKLADWGLDVWRPIDTDIDDFFEETQEDDKEDMFKINFVYDQERGKLVQDKLKDIDKNLEEALWNLVSKEE